VRRLANGDPRFHRVHCDAKVPCKLGETNQIRAASGQRSKEALELREVADLAHGANVTLEIRLDVGAIPNLHVAFGRAEELWVATAKEVAPDLGYGWRPRKRRPSGAILPWKRRSGTTLDLAPREREELENGGAAGEGLGDLLEEKKILRAGEDVLALPPPVGIDPLLHVGEQVRRILNLDEDRRRRVGIEKAPGVRRRRAADIGKLERNVAGMGPE